MQAEQMGVQLHCLRHAVRDDFSGALDSIRRLGLAVVELVSFPGCRGNPWGDFGNATDLPARSIGRALRDAGLRCPSVMVSEQELASDRVEAVLDWVGEVGADKVVLTAFARSGGSSMAHWHAKLAGANAHAERCRRHGIDFVLHTQPELWESIEDRRPIDLLGGELDRTLVSLEYDPSGAVMYGADPLALLTEWHDTFHAVHLRDGYTPPQPVAYLPALPLGQGGIDWGAFVSASRNAAVQWYFLEMEVADPSETLLALSCSLEHLATRGMISRAFPLEPSIAEIPYPHPEATA